MTPTILLVDYSTVAKPFTMDQLCAALQIYVEQYITPTWGFSATLQVLPSPPPKDQVVASLAGKWALFFFDDATQAGALGYHAEEQHGVVDGYVFVRTTLAAGETVSSTASHELAEMLGDPQTNLTREIGNGTFVIQELADAVENSGFLINGLEMSNLVTPAWFDPSPPPGSKFDLMGHLTQSYPQLEAGGYISVFSRGRWRQIFGSAAARLRFGKLKTHAYSRHSRRQARRKP